MHGKIFKQFHYDENKLHAFGNKIQIRIELSYAVRGGGGGDGIFRLDGN